VKEKDMDLSDFVLTMKPQGDFEEYTFAEWEDGRQNACHRIVWLIDTRPDGKMWISGDYGNWVFTRVFHPIMKEKLSRKYFKEKIWMGYRSVGPGDTYDQDCAEKQINDLYERRVEEAEEEGNLKEVQDQLISDRDQLLGAIWEHEAALHGAVWDVYDGPLVAECETPDGMTTAPWLLMIMDVYDHLHELQPEIKDFDEYDMEQYA